MTIMLLVAVLAQPPRYVEAEKDYWIGNSVIYGHVESVVPDTEVGAGNWLLTIRPQATLSGRFDCGVEPTIKVRLFVSFLGSAIKQQPPQAGDNVLAMIIQQWHGGYWVTNQPVSLMPLVSKSRPGILTVKDFSDSRVAATLATIQERRKGHAEDKSKRTDPHRVWPPNERAWEFPKSPSDLRPPSAPPESTPKQP